MANPFNLVPQLGTAAPVHELYNIAHSRPFSLLFGNYSWALGIAGGLVLVWAINVIAGRRHGVEYRFTMPVAVAFLVAGFLNVLAEVQQPSRLIYGYFLGWDKVWSTAIIKYGIILLPLMLALCWWLTFQAMDREALNRSITRLSPLRRGLVDFFTLWSRRYSVLDGTVSRRIVLSVLIFLGLFAPLYSGVFLMYEHGVAIWNSPAQTVIFLATAIGKAALIMLVVLPALAWLAAGYGGRPKNTPLREHLRWTAVIAIAVAAITWYGWLWWMARLGSIEDLRAVALFNGPYASSVFWNWTIAGVIIPLVLLATPFGRQRWAQFLALIGALWGGYAVRMLILLGGEALVRSGAGFQAFIPSGQMLRDTGFSVLALLGVLAVLLLAFRAEGSPKLGDAKSRQGPAG